MIVLYVLWKCGCKEMDKILTVERSLRIVLAHVVQNLSYNLVWQIVTIIDNGVIDLHKWDFLRVLCVDNAKYSG